MQKYLVVVGGSASIHVIADDEDEACEIVERLCEGDLDAPSYDTLDEREVRDVESLCNWEVLDAWLDIWSNDPADADQQVKG